MAAYVPPHKRHSKLRAAHDDNNDQNQKKIVYSEDCISRWFLSCSKARQSVQFARLFVRPKSQVKSREKPLILVNTNNAPKEDYEGPVAATGQLRIPLLSVAERVEDDILLAYQRVKNGTEISAFGVVKPRLVIRFGKFLFNGHPEVSIESRNDEAVAESKLMRSSKWLHTDLPSSYIEFVKKVAVPKIGLQIEKVKETYNVKLFDMAHPDANISCKCTLEEDKRLNLYKVQFNTVRRMVVDVSCLDQNLDLRLTMDSKRILNTLTEVEVKSMKEWIDSAVIDPNAKGGLRWPSPACEESSTRNRYSLCGICHTTTTSYGNSTLRLKVRDADRLYFMAKPRAGRATQEMFMILKGISSNLQEQKIEKGLISEKLKDVLRTIWDNFMSCEPFPQ